MTATVSLPQHPRPQPLGVAQPSPSASSATPVLDSTALLQGHRAVAIEHNGFLYRLQATKLGKLILTK